MKINGQLTDVTRILVINLGGMGDCLLSVPSLKSLRRLYPKAYIALLTLSRSKEVFNDMPLIDEIISADLNFKGWISFYKVLINLRQKKFDMILNLRSLASLKGTIEMAFIFFIINSKYKVGRNTEKRGFFLNIKLPEKYIGTKHDIEYNMDLIKLLGDITSDKTLELNLTKEDTEFADSFFRNHSIGNEDIAIAITPGAPYPSKRWPIKNFISLVAILSKYGYKVIILGSSEEKYIVEEFQKVNYPNLLLAIGETKLKNLAALIKKCSVLITNDTGPMHIACIVGTPLIAIFGPGHLERFDPRKISQSAIVFHRNVGCSPCEKVNCKSKKCLSLIMPEEVAKACVELLKREKNDSAVLPMVSQSDFTI